MYLSTARPDVDRIYDVTDHQIDTEITSSDKNEKIKNTNPINQSSLKQDIKTATTYSAIHNDNFFTLKKDLKSELSPQSDEKCDNVINEYLEDSSINQPVADEVIGIDFGTSYFRVGLWNNDNDNVSLISNDELNRGTPSCIVVDYNGDILFGESALAQSRFYPKSHISNYRRGFHYWQQLFFYSNR